MVCQTKNTDQRRIETTWQAAEKSTVDDVDHSHKRRGVDCCFIREVLNEQADQLLLFSAHRHNFHTIFFFLNRVFLLALIPDSFPAVSEEPSLPAAAALSRFFALGN
jgi:hypothetical protein